MSGILVVIEDRAGRVSRIGWEALAAGNSWPRNWICP